MSKLYLGTEPCEGTIHYPVIKIVPLEVSPQQWEAFPTFTHILFTSKNSVKLLSYLDLQRKQMLAIGQKTASALIQAGYTPSAVAKIETQEGMIDLLKMQDMKEANVLYPRSAIARKCLEQFLAQQGIRHQIWDLYTTVFQKPLPLPDLNLVDEIIFTSPSTVRGFIEAFGPLPLDKKLTCIGPITQAELEFYL